MKAKFYYAYALLVSVAAVAYLLVSVPSASWSLVRFMVPEFTVNQHDFRAHQNNRFYCEQASAFCHPNQHRPSGKTAMVEPPSKKAITEQRKASWKVILQGERRDGLKGIVDMGLGSVFAFLMFWFHRRILKSKEDDGSPG